MDEHRPSRLLTDAEDGGRSLESSRRGQPGRRDLQAHEALVEPRGQAEQVRFHTADRSPRLERFRQ
jgi:hypothetical protein